jgi:transposase
MGIDILIVFGYWCVVVIDGQQDINTALDRVVQLEVENARLRELALAGERDRAELQAKLAASEQTLERLRQAYTNALEQLQLAKRRLFVAKAERREAVPEQLQLDLLAKQVEQLGDELTKAEHAAGNETPDAATGKPAERKRSESKPKGRRNLASSDLPLIRVEIIDPELDGKAERIGFEDSWKLGYERGGMRRIQMARVVYKVTTSADESPQIVTAPAPKELFRRSLLAPALIAHLLVAKYVLGVPFARQESLYRVQGEELDRGTMCRYAEDAGATLGAIVDAMAHEAKTTAFCLSTDATGVAIQPTYIGDGKRQPCRKGHFFVVLADRDHVFFEYQPKHTSKAVSEMFRGFHGYIQADANAVYDALFRGRPSVSLWEEEPEDPPPKEVGCWSHCRRNFWDAAVCKYAEGLTGLRMIDALFEADAPLWKLPPVQRQQARQQILLPMVDTIFNWVREEAKTQRPRGLVSKALGYALRQETPLRRFLEDPRLKLDNNASERAIRTVAIGRKNWLFCGSDDHAQAAANIFSLVASCKLHGLDPELYLAELIRVMPYWPWQRYLELCPRCWLNTRARLDSREIELPVGHITVPPAAAAE